MSVVGPVRFPRAYYHCEHCKLGQFPWHKTLGLSSCDLTRGAAQLVSLAGTLTSFEEAAKKVLPKLSGVGVCASTVERTTERAGQQVGEKLAAGEVFGEPTAWDWTKDAEGKTVAYIGADSTGVGMQGPGGSAADGRMAAVGMIWNGDKKGHVRYMCGLTGGLAALGEPLRNQAGQVGMDAAQRWIAISDGGAGIADWLRVHFPRVEAVILDFYHAAEHLCDWAKALHSSDEAERVGGEWCHRLKHEGGQVVLDALRTIDVSDLSADKREAHRQLLVYFENQKHRMDYPMYRAKGWLIGSGPVEAACKQVVNQRLKGTGMRWSEAGADAVCHLRALFRSEKGQWDACWATLTA